MKNLFKLILLLIFAIPKLASAQNIQYIGTKDNTVVTRNVARDDSAHEFALTDTSKHPSRPGRMISFNGSPYWWNGIFWYRLNGDTSTVPGQVNADWTAVSGVALILHKPTFATVATTGSYTDLINKPTIPAAQVASDWNAASGTTQVLNKPRMIDSIWRIPGEDSIRIRVRNNDNTFRSFAIVDSIGGGGGSGTVDTVKVGNFSPLFSTTVTNPTTNPNVSFTAMNVTAHKYYGNNTGSTTIPSFSSIVLGDLPTIPLANTDATNGLGIAPILGGVIRVDTSVIGYPKFISIFRPPNTDSVYYQVKTNASTTVNTLGLIDSVRISAKGAANAYPLTYQTGPSSFYTRKLLPGTNIGFSVATDSTLTINNSLTNVVNSIQVINAGNGRSLAAGLNSSRPSGTLGDFYLSTDISQLSYFNGTSWIPIAGAGAKDTVHLARTGIGAFSLYTSVAGDTLYQSAFKNSTTVGFVKNSDSTVSANSLLAGVNSVNITGANVSLVNDISSGTYKLYGFDGASTRNFITFSSLPVTVGTTNGLFPYQYKNRIDSNLTVLNDRFYPTLDSVFTASPTLDTLYSKRFEFVAGIGINITNNGDIHKNSYTITATGPGGSGNANVGSGYRWAIPGTANIKTLFSGPGIGIDSVANTNGLTLTIDPLVVATVSGVQSLSNKTLVSPRMNTTSTATYVWTASDAFGNGSWQPATSGFVNPMTTLGDMMFENATPVAARLPGNTTTTPQVLMQTGTGSVSATPIWHTLVKGDIGLSNVENTVLSTWPGTANINTVGTITSGTWNGSVVDAAHGGTGNSSYTPYAVVTGGTSSTGPLQQVSGVGVANQALVSNGASTLPTWQSIVNSITGTTNEIIASASTGGISLSTPQPIGTLNSPTFAGLTINGASAFNRTTGGNVISLQSNVQSSMYLLAANGGAGFVLGRSTSSNDNNDFFIYDAAASTNRFTINSSGKSTVNGTLQVTDGTQGAGKIFTSDASGNGSWQSLSAQTDYLGAGSISANTPNTSGLGTGATISVTGNKVSGIITVVTGTGASGGYTGPIGKLVPGTNFSTSTPRIMINAASTTAAALGGFPYSEPSNLSSSLIYLYTAGTMNFISSTTYVWSYHILQ